MKTEFTLLYLQSWMKEGTSIFLAVAVSLAGCKPSAQKEPAGQKENVSGGGGLQYALPPGAFSFDTDHTFIQFSTGHMGVAQVHGRFNRSAGWIIWDEKNPEKNAIKMIVDTATIDTNQPKRDQHLQGPDFFDAKKFPRAEFTSQKIESLGKNKFKVVGSMEIHGVKKQLDVVFKKTGHLKKDHLGKERIGGRATFQINRNDFAINGIDKKMPGAAGEVAGITIALEAVK